MVRVSTRTKKIRTFKNDIGLPHRTLFKVLERPFKYRLSLEGTIVPWKLISHMKTGKSQMINGYITEADFDRVYERAYHSRTPDTHM